MSRLLSVCFLAVLAWTAASQATDSDASKQWRFKVLLDGKPIGHHNFTLIDKDGKRDLTSEARFNVKILFVTAYRYAHDSRELFQGDCLERIDARTDDNGKDLAVKGSRDANGFMLASEAIEQPACIMTFAYWNPNMLSQTRLLNAQNGKYEPVTIRKVASETLSVRGNATPAEHYFLSGEQLKIDLWYSTANEWLALKSTTEDGRQLLYQLE